MRRLASRLGDQWRAGDRLPAVRQIAKDLSLSHTTVHRAVREMTRSGFLMSRPRQGLFVTDRYSDARLRSIFAEHAAETPTAARPLAGMRVLVLHGNDSTHMLPALSSIMVDLAPGGCRVDQACYPTVPRGGVRLPRIDDDIDVVFLINPNTDVSLEEVRGRGLVIVSSAAGLPRGPIERYDVVSVEQEQGGELAGERLRRLGCDAACFVGVSQDDVSMRAGLEITSYLRLHGFEIGFGGRLPASHLLPAKSHSPYFGAMAAKRYAAMSPRPRGVFVASDDLAIGFISGLTALGLSAGRDYALVSFDGQARMGAGACSVRVPAAAMGRQAVQLLTSRLADPQQPIRRVLLGCSLDESPGEVSPGPQAITPGGT